MKRHIITTVVTVMLGIIVFSPPVLAYDLFSKCTSTNGDCAVVSAQKNLDYTTGATGVWLLVQQALIILGGLAVIMIVIGGIKYAVSNGESSAIASAKNTILYSVIGLVVALSAATIIGFVTNYFG